MKILLVMCVVSSASVAFAQPGAELPRRPDPSPDQTTQPAFVVLDQADASTAAGFELAYLGLDGDFSDDVTLLRALVHGRYVSPETGVGGYFRLPFTYARASRGGTSETVTDVGNLEIGAIYSPRINQPGTGIILRAGLTLPTGERGDDEAEVGLLGSFLALSDLYNSLPRGTTLKLGASPVLRSGVLFARADLGFDWNFDAADAVLGKVVHFSAGVGADLGPASVMLESENATVFSDRDGDQSLTLDAIAVSARYTANGVSPYLAVTVPIDEDLRELFDYAVTAGVEIRR